jgi:hypothetical protein
VSETGHTSRFFLQSDKKKNSVRDKCQCEKGRLHWESSGWRCVGIRGLLLRTIGYKRWPLGVKGYFPMDEISVDMYNLKEVIELPGSDILVHIT